MANYFYHIVVCLLLAYSTGLAKPDYQKLNKDRISAIFLKLKIILLENKAEKPMNKLMILASAFLLVFGMAGLAIAIPLIGDLAVDFRTDTWQTAIQGNSNTATVGPITVTAMPQSADLYTDQVIDGIGVNSLGSDESDEVDGSETLAVAFTGGMLLSGLWVTDLFDSPDGVDGEEGRVTLNNATVFDFFGNQADQANGEIYVDFGGSIYVQNAFFEIIGESHNNEFAVAGITVAPVPEPATMLLLGIGLCGLAGVGRRKL